jgi:hypothetical protein
MDLWKLKCKDLCIHVFILQRANNPEKEQIEGFSQLIPVPACTIDHPKAQPRDSWRERPWWHGWRLFMGPTPRTPNSPKSIYCHSQMSNLPAIEVKAEFLIWHLPSNRLMRYLLGSWLYWTTAIWKGEKVIFTRRNMNSRYKFTFLPVQPHLSNFAIKVKYCTTQTKRSTS